MNEKRKSGEGTARNTDINFPLSRQKYDSNSYFLLCFCSRFGQYFNGKTIPAVTVFDSVIPGRSFDPSLNENTNTTVIACFLMFFFSFFVPGRSFDPSLNENTKKILLYLFFALVFVVVPGRYFDPLLSGSFEEKIKLFYPEAK